MKISTREAKQGGGKGGKLPHDYPNIESVGQSVYEGACTLGQNRTKTRKEGAKKENERRQNSRSPIKHRKHVKIRCSTEREKFNEQKKKMKQKVIESDEQAEEAAGRDSNNRTEPHEKHKGGNQNSEDTDDTDLGKLGLSISMGGRQDTTGHRKQGIRKRSHEHDDLNERRRSKTKSTREGKREREAKQDGENSA